MKKPRCIKPPVKETPVLFPGSCNPFDQCLRIAEYYNLQHFPGSEGKGWHKAPPYHKFFKKTIPDLAPNIKNWLEFIKSNDRRMILVISEDFSLFSGIAALTLYNAYAGFDFVYKNCGRCTKQAIEKYLFDPVTKQEDRPPMFRHDETFSRCDLPLLGTSLVLRNVNPHHIEFFRPFINIVRENRNVLCGHIIISAPEIPALSPAELDVFTIFNPEQKVTFCKKTNTISFGEKRVVLEPREAKAVLTIHRLCAGRLYCTIAEFMDEMEKPFDENKSIFPQIAEIYTNCFEPVNKKFYELTNITGWLKHNKNDKNIHMKEKLHLQNISKTSQTP